MHGEWVIATLTGSLTSPVKRFYKVRLYNAFPRKPFQENRRMLQSSSRVDDEADGSWPVSKFNTRNSNTSLSVFFQLENFTIQVTDGVLKHFRL